MVDDQTPVIWRTLATHMINISCKITMGTNIFRHPEIKVAHTRRPAHAALGPGPRGLEKARGTRDTIPPKHWMRSRTPI